MLILKKVGSNIHAIIQTLNHYFDITTAKIACQSFGKDWKVDHTTDRALVCTKENTRWTDNCHSCSSWRMLVWADGGFEFDKGYSRQLDDPATVAGKYYGGHEPCNYGNNYPLCGDWISTGNFLFLLFPN